jgi:hypothetical protein
MHGQLRTEYMPTVSITIVAPAWPDLEDYENRRRYFEILKVDEREQDIIKQASQFLTPQTQWLTLRARIVFWELP